MTPDKLFTRMSYNLNRHQIKGYNTFVAVPRITSDPPGRNFLVHYNRYSGLTLVATDATENQMLEWSDWHYRISSIDYSQNPPSTYYHPPEKVRVEPKKSAPAAPAKSESKRPKNDKIDRIEELINQSIPGYEIAKRLNISRAVVSYHKRRLEGKKRSTINKK